MADAVLPSWPSPEFDRVAARAESLIKKSAEEMCEPAPHFDMIEVMVWATIQALAGTDEGEGL